MSTWLCRSLILLSSLNDRLLFGSVFDSISLKTGLGAFGWLIPEGVLGPANVLEAGLDTLGTCKVGSELYPELLFVTRFLYRYSFRLLYKSFCMLPLLPPRKTCLYCESGGLCVECRLPMGDRLLPLFACSRLILYDGVPDKESLLSMPGREADATRFLL